MTISSSDDMEQLEPSSYIAGEIVKQNSHFGGLFDGFLYNEAHIHYKPQQFYT